MNKIEQWLNAIINEDGHRMSAGSLRTIEMIRRELARQQNLQQCNVSGELPISCVNDFENPEYCSQRNNHLCQKCKDW